MSLLAAGASLLVGCGEEDSKTLLNPEGPPMVRQVFVQERITITNSDGTTSQRNATQLAFGSHPDIPAEADDGEVIAALALGNTIRIVLDELVDGSTLEQIACADGTFDDIPSGTTPDDIADCAGLDRSDCTAVCTTIDPTTSQPVGILDENDDFAADAFRFKEDVVQLRCGDADMPIDIEESFYNPSGNQQIPAGDIGLAGLGPAIVLVPVGMRTGSNCEIQIADTVVDKQGNAVCAPPGGDITADCPAPGDTSLIQFGTQVFELRASSPRDEQENFNPNVTAQSPIILQFNMNVEASQANLDRITLTEDGVGEVAAYTVMLASEDPSIVNLTVDGGLEPLTAYTIDVDAAFEEEFGGTLAQAIELNFTTRDVMAEPDAAPALDAGNGDAGGLDAGNLDADM